MMKSSSPAQHEKKIVLPTVPSKWTWMEIFLHLLHVRLAYLILRSVYNNSFGGDATGALAFYGVYHREPMNQVIHFFGVPLLVLSMLLFQCHLPWTKRIVLSGMPYIPDHHPSWATFIAVFYLIKYLRMDVIGGLMYAPSLYGLYAIAVRWTAHDQRMAYNQASPTMTTNKEKKISWMGTGRAVQYAILLNAFAFYVQVHPGHKIIEGAQPAFTDNFTDAFISAPLFAFYEGVWYLGVRKDFQLQVLDLVSKYTQELCEQGSSMRVCATLQ